MNNVLPVEDLIDIFEYDPVNSKSALIWKVKIADKIKISSAAGCKAPTGYYVVKCLGKIYLAHRIVWALHYGSWPKSHLDHINRIKNDNRIENLREATHAENHQNRSRQKNNASGFTGVHWHSRDKKWEARIQVNKKQKHLGYFDTPEKAYECYKRAKQTTHTFNPEVIDE